MRIILDKFIDHGWDVDLDCEKGIVQLHVPHSIDGFDLGKEADRIAEGLALSDADRDAVYSDLAATIEAVMFRKMVR